MSKKRILIIGPTNSGKTTLSKKIAQEEDLSVHSMGEFFRTSESLNNLITGNAISLLVEDWECNLKYIKNKFNKEIKEIDNVIFEGFRNPYEFHQFVTQDCMVIVLNPSFIDYKDDFERNGIEAILKSISWLEENLNLTVININYDKYSELEETEL